MDHRKSTAHKPDTPDTVSHDAGIRRGKTDDIARTTTKISRTSRARRTAHISRETTTISRATQTTHSRNSLQSTASQTTSPLNSPIDIATKTESTTKIFSTRPRTTSATEQTREQNVRSDRRKDLTDQSSVTTHTTYTSNFLSRPTVLMMAARQQEDNNRRPTDVLFLVRSAIRYLASIITGDQYRQMQIVQPMLINIKHHFDGLDESTPNRQDVLQLIDFLTNLEFHHYQNNQAVEAIVNRIMIDQPDYEHGCSLQHLLDQLDLIQQKMTPDEMTSLVRLSNYVSLPQISYFYQKRKVQSQKVDDEMAYITQDRVNDILHRIRRVISPSPFTQV